jgi:lysozyme
MMWQYTDMGRVPGIKGNVDRNAFAGTEEDWLRFTGQSMMRVAEAAPVAPLAPMANVPVPRPKGLIARN